MKLGGLLPGRLVKPGHFRPVDHLPKRLQVIRPLVLILQIVSVLPHIHTQHGLAFTTGHRLAHDRVVLVGRGDNFQLAVVDHQPGPAAAETAHAGGFKLLLEGLQAAEGGIEGAPPALGAMSFQNIEWLTWPPALLRTAPRMFSGTEARSPMSASADLASSTAWPARALFKLVT